MVLASVKLESPRKRTCEKMDKYQFLVNDKVEVRTEEEGFLGSWHVGTVIRCYKKGWHYEYRVKYDNILVDDGSEYLVDEVCVSRVFSKSNQPNYRGRIRPLPPPCELVKRWLPYGTCVDAYYMDAWWEGVVFDHEDGSEQRRIFFPDQGDDIMIKLDDLRITKDWNEVTSDWEPRGTWLFLELIEEIERECCLPTSTRQIWYDLQEKDGFRKLGEWTSPSKALWEDLLLQTICDIFRTVINNRFQKVNLPENAIMPLEHATPVQDLNMSLESDFAKTSVIVPAAELLTFDTSEAVAGAESCPEAVTSNAIMGGERSQKEFSTSSAKTNEQQLSSLSNNNEWQLAGLDIVPGTKYCPEAVVQYVSSGAQKAQWLINDVRMHLAHLNWKMEFRRDKLRDKVMIRMRYTSPSGNHYYSLRLVCLHLVESCSDNHDNSLVHKSENNSEESLCMSPLRKTDMRQKINYPELSKGKGKREGRTSLQKLKMEKTTRSSKELPNEKKNCRSTRKLCLRKRVQQNVDPNPSHHNPLTVLSWLIDKNIILPRAKVFYSSAEDKQLLARGRICRDGIKCDCCKKVYSIRNFEVHTGSKLGRPATNICLEDGRSLLDCQRQLIRNEMMMNLKAARTGRLDIGWLHGENDYICSVCREGGDLILCDRCPSSFHKSCVGLKEVPHGDWFCPSCCCRICGQNELQRITEYSMDGAQLSCTQCQRKYHGECLKDRRTNNLDSFPKDYWFCCEKCEQIFKGLQDLIGKSFPVGVDNLTWTLLKPIPPDNKEFDASDGEALIERHIKLCIALDVMHECFEPAEEPLTRRDIIKDIIFNTGSELNRLDFQGFYTMLLEKDDELITAASIRVYGEVAELPFIGTRVQYRQHGMCRKLMNVLEKMFVELGVQRLILPAVPSLLNMWAGSFGFSKMTDSERLEFVDHPFVVFQETVLCHRLLTKISSADTSPSSTLSVLSGNASTIDENMVFEGSNVVAETLPGDQMKENGTVEQEQINATLEKNNSANKYQVSSEVTVNEEANVEAKDCDSEISLSFVVEDSNLDKEHNHDCNGHTNLTKRSNDGSNGDWKCYKRRRGSL